MFCGNCGKQINEGSNFCSNCGFKNDDSKSLCPKCGNEVKGFFCGMCGYNVFGVRNKSSESNTTLYVCLGSVGLLLVLLGCLVPFATAQALFVSESVNFISGDGVVILIISLVCFILLLLKQGWISFALNVVSFIITLIDGVNVSSQSFENDFVSVRLDYGFYLIFIGLILAMIMSILLAVKKNKNN